MPFLIINQKSKLIHKMEKTLTFDNDVILLKSVCNKDKKNNYYNIFLEKGLYELPKNNDNK